MGLLRRRPCPRTRHPRTEQREHRRTRESADRRPFRHLHRAVRGLWCQGASAPCPSLRRLGGNKQLKLLGTLLWRSWVCTPGPSHGRDLAPARPSRATDGSDESDEAGADRRVPQSLSTLTPFPRRGPWARTATTANGPRDAMLGIRSIRLIRGLPRCPGHGRIDPTWLMRWPWCARPVGSSGLRVRPRSPAHRRGVADPGASDPPPSSARVTDTPFVRVRPAGSGSVGRNSTRRGLHPRSSPKHRRRSGGSLGLPGRGFEPRRQRRRKAGASKVEAGFLSIMSPQATQGRRLQGRSRLPFNHVATGDARPAPPRTKPASFQSCRQRRRKAGASKVEAGFLPLRRRRRRASGCDSR